MSEKLLEDLNLYLYNFDNERRVFTLTESDDKKLEVLSRQIAIERNQIISTLRKQAIPHRLINEFNIKV